ncbi:unnamed protein product [Cochlearia groenlandica]
MEPAKIDWNRIDSHFVEDVFYEHIKGPKWFDFLAPDNLDSIDDDAWFCKSDCNHPKKPEDFFHLTPTSSKFCSLYSIISIDLYRRRGHALSPSQDQDTENQNPNLAATPPSQQAKSWRAAIKSSSVKKMSKETPRLKTTQSARNLFSGRDILGHISEFCYELKRLATKVTEREDTVKKPEVSVIHNQPYTALDLELKKERLPLLEVSKDVKGSNFKENRRRKKRVYDSENIPKPLKLENVKSKEHERLLQIRTNPPSPQCFSDNRTASLKPLRTKTMEKGVLGEMVKKKEDKAATEEEEEEKSNKEAKGLDILWFLKPCTNS